MSNEVSLFKAGNLAIPAYLRNSLDETTKSLMGGDSTKRISIEGSVFRMMVGGKEVAQNTDRAMNIVIVRAAEHNGRTFYKDTYVKGVKAQPTCWSPDDITPSPRAKDPQSTKCATCPQNTKGSGQNGSKACRYSRRLAVTLENDINGDIYALSLPAGSIFGSEPKKMGIQQYARFLGGHGVGTNSVVTEMRFDTDAGVPKLVFTAVRPLEEAEYAAILEKKDSLESVNAVTMTVAELDGDAPTPPAALFPTPTPPASAPKTKAKAKVEEEEIAEPQKRESNNAPAKVVDVKSILSDWADDE